MKWLTSASIDELGNTLIKDYMKKQATNNFKVDIEGFVTEYLKLPILYHTIAEKDLSKLGFISDGKTPLTICCNGKKQTRIYPKGTIVIEKCLCGRNETGRRRFTIAHEAAHYIVDKSISTASFHREFDRERSYTADELKCLFNINETNVDRLAGALLLPSFMVRNYLNKNKRSNGIAIYDDSFIRPEDTYFLQKMASDMGSSLTALQIRIKHLGLYISKPMNEYIAELGFGKDDELIGQSIEKLLVIADIMADEEINPERKELSKMYSFGDDALHLKNNYGFALSMSSSRTYNYESINNQNKTGWYIGDGMTNIYTNANKIGGRYWQEINPYFIPGTTVDTQKREEISITNAYLSNQDFVGGVTLDDKYLTAAMCLESYHNETESDVTETGHGVGAPLHNCTLTAKKAWFCFDDEIICLGCDINANDGYQILTVLENTENNVKVIEKDCVKIDGIGVYKTLDKTEIVTSKDGKYTQCYVEHGKNPKNQSYEYAIIPNSELTEVKAEVLENNSKIQAVKCGDVVGIVFYEAGEYYGITVDNPCIILTDGNKYTVADPTQKLGKINVKINSKEYDVDLEKGKTAEINR